MKQPLTPPGPLRARLALVAAALGSLALAPAAQKLERDYFEDTTYGYKLRLPKDWEAIPVKPELKEQGIAVIFKGEEIAINKDNMSADWQPDLYVYVLDKVESKTGEEATGLRGRISTEQGPTGIEARLYWRRFSDFDPEKPELDETKHIKKLTARHRVWNVAFPSYAGSFPMKLEVWTFPLSDRVVSLVFTMMEQRYDKWDKTFQSIAKTFTEIDRTARTTLGDDAGYADLMRFHEEEAARIPGWRVLPTESKRFIVKTSADNDKFVDAVIERLESSRDLFERDFPPAKPIEAVSVVRVCGTREEFQQYGQSSGGVVGWFNPGSKELVLFDASDIDRKISYAVMTHEAFHQYCHFLFEESEAHRWFDEGHGDYYGGFQFRGRKAIVDRMPGGLDRLLTLRDILRDGSWVPIREHINFDHPQWQSRGVPSYAQSWSIVYMLRQGMLGEVNRKYWDEAYADIIPNYMATLHAGYQEEYAKQREAAEARAKAADEEFDPDAVAYYVDVKARNNIWKEAIDASWGKIDLDRFQEHWLAYVETL